MKKTLFMMMTVALVSGQAFGYEPTVLNGIHYTNGSDRAGVSDRNGTGTTGGNVLIEANAGGDNCSGTHVYGAFAKNANPGKTDASNNKVTMTSGEVSHVEGAYAWDSDGDETEETGFSANNNSVIITGGTVHDYVTGAFVNGPAAEATNNKVVLVASTAGTNVATSGIASVYGAQSIGGNLHDNQIHLIGADGTATIDGQTYEGQGTLTVGTVYGVECMNRKITPSGNSIDIYGHSIEAKGLVSFNRLNFHVVNTDETIITLTNEYVELELDSVSLSFDFSEPIAMDTELTLVESAGGITMSASQLDKTWAVMSDSGIRTAKLSLSDDKKTLKLTVTPEPATATLSLLALAGLAARRRRH